MSDAAAAAGTAGTPAEAPNATSQSDDAGRSAGAAAVPSYKGTKHKIVVEGKEQELDYDEVLRLASHGRAANKRFQEAADLRKQAEASSQRAAVVDAVENGNWRPLVEKVGVEKAKQFAEQFLLEMLEWQEMPEDKRARLIAERERDQVKDQLTKREKAEQEAQQLQLEHKVGSELETEISEALGKLGRKPTPRLVMRIAEQMYANLDAAEGDGQAQRLPAGEALNRAVRGIHHDIAEFLTDMPADEILKVLPPQTQDALRQAFADQVMAQDPFRSGQQRTVPQGQEPQRRRRTKVQGTDNLFKDLEKKYGGR